MGSSSTEEDGLGGKLLRTEGQGVAVSVSGQQPWTCRQGAEEASAGDAREKTKATLFNPGVHCGVCRGVWTLSGLRLNSAGPDGPERRKPGHTRQDPNQPNGCHEAPEHGFLAAPVPAHW